MHIGGNRWIQETLCGIKVDSRNTWWNIGGFRKHLVVGGFRQYWRNICGFREHLMECRWIQGTLGGICVGLIGGFKINKKEMWSDSGTARRKCRRIHGQLEGNVRRIHGKFEGNVG